MSFWTIVLFQNYSITAFEIAINALKRNSQTERPYSKQGKVVQPSH